MDYNFLSDEFVVGVYVPQSIRRLDVVASPSKYIP